MNTTAPPPSDGLVRDAELVGHWDSTPFDVGAMESSETAFLPDGSGWSVWASASSGLEVTCFRWHCPEPGLLELQAYWLTSGTWERNSAAWCFAEVDTDEPCHDVVRTSYRIGPQDAPYGEEPIEGVALTRRSRSATSTHAASAVSTQARTPPTTSATHPRREPHPCRSTSIFGHTAW
ncbi:hypothetical protein ABIA33_007123 [Streptacidiphilus sp. MAP12-16]|uniref:hypothetical protein n=1 Tax=Streptacidiphilus sp. MAP12-16 TaxID=3156300 RepID=UPI003513FF06